MLLSDELYLSDILTLSRIMPKYLDDLVSPAASTGVP